MPFGSAPCYCQYMVLIAHSDHSVSAESAKVSLRARKQDFVRESIWVAAIDLFAAQGFEETTIDDIVNAAGTSRRTFFRYFESKRDLIAQPVVSYGASLSAAIQSSPPDPSLAELFRHVVLQVAQSSVADPRIRKVMQVAAKYPGAREAQLSRLAEVQDQVADAFSRRCKDDITAHVLAGLTFSALSLAYRIWFAEGNKDIGSAVQDALARISAVACGNPSKTSDAPRKPGRKH